MSQTKSGFPHLNLVEKPRILIPIEDDLPEVIFEPLSIRDNCDVQTISKQICELSTNMQKDNAKLLEVVALSKNNAGKLQSDRKKRRVSYRLNLAEEEPLGIICKYSSGEENTEILSYDISGTVKVCNLKTGNWVNDNAFAICFPKERIFVLGDKAKVKKENLMNAFVRAGVTFEATVPKGEIAEALFNFFAPKIECAKDVWKMLTHQGWSENMFFDANYPPTVERQEFLGLPLYKKRFSYVKPASEDFQRYFKQIAKIKSRYARATILMFPFYGIINSLLAENVNLSPIVANFVMLNEKDPRKICDLLQVFNRNDIGLNSLDVSDKEMDEIIKSANDEVVLLDAMCEEDKKYYKDKITSNALYCSNVFLGKRSCKNRKKAGGHAALAIFSTQKIIVGGCVNIIVTEDFFKKNRNNDEINQSMEAVLTAFVEFVKMNFLEVKKIIRKEREQKDGRERLLAVMQEILTKFFQTEGFDMLESAKFSPDFNFKEILNEIVDTEELLENFRISVKKQISKFVVEPKGKKYEKNWIYYNSEWIYFPTLIFNRILGIEGMLSYKEEILLELHEQKYLRKDLEGFSRKLMISGERFETYQIAREFFDEVGELSITEMGKVICND